MKPSLAFIALFYMLVARGIEGDNSFVAASLVLLALAWVTE